MGPPGLLLLPPLLIRPLLVPPEVICRRSCLNPGFLASPSGGSVTDLPQRLPLQCRALLSPLMSDRAKSPGLRVLTKTCFLTLPPILPPLLLLLLPPLVQLPPPLLLLPPPLLLLPPTGLIPPALVTKHR